MGFVQFRAIETNMHFLNQPLPGEFCPKIFFSKIRPTITTVKMTFSNFFGTLCSNRLFPKKNI